MSDVPDALVEKAAEAVFGEYERVLREEFGRNPDPNSRELHHLIAERYARTVLAAVLPDLTRPVVTPWCPVCFEAPEPNGPWAYPGDYCADVHGAALKERRTGGAPDPSEFALPTARPVVDRDALEHAACDCGHHPRQHVGPLCTHVGPGCTALVDGPPEGPPAVACRCERDFADAILASGVVRECRCAHDD